MPNYKSLKTYSKTEKVVNYSTLFDNKEPYDFDSSSNSESMENNDKKTDLKSPLDLTAQTISKSTKKTVYKENMIPKQTYGKRAVRSKKVDEKPIEEKLPRKKVEEKVPVLGKRKVQKKEIKLFQISTLSDSTNKSDSTQNTENMEDTYTEIENAMKNVAIVSMKEEPVNEKGKQTLKSSNSVTNLKATSRGAKTRKVTSENIKIEPKKGGIKKSKSTSNVISSKKIQLVASDVNRAKIVKEINQTKSILKSRNDQSVENKDASVYSSERHESTSKKTNAHTATSKSKKAVKILDIDDKNDQIPNFKIDNRTKNLASTSTPSGLRRRPLKVLQEISMIVTPNKKS
jgi:hypothetical protein